MMTNHFDKLTIKAFRQFEDATFEGLGRINLLVGENNAGKSSVLESIEYLCNPMDPLALLDIARRREITTKDLEATMSLRWLFPKKAYTTDDDFLKSAIEVTSSSATTQRTVHADFERFRTDIAGLADPGAPITTTTTTGGLTTTTTTGESTTRTTPPPEADLRREGVRLTLAYESTGEESQGSFAKEEFTLLEGVRLEVRSSVKTSEIPAASITSVSHRVETTQTRSLSKATIDYLKRETVSLLQLIDPDIRGVDILDTGGRSVIWLELLGMGYVPLSVCGDGLRRILSFATGLSQAQAGVLLIDEIETALHKDAFVKVFKWLIEASKKLDVQIFATTHSLEAVDAILGANLETPEDLVVFQLADRGKVGIKRFAGEVLQNIRFEQRVDVR